MRILILSFLSVFLFTASLLFAKIPFFLPPEGWQCVIPKNPSQHITMGFVSKEKSFFRPSLNLAIEKTDASLLEYVQAVKNLYREDLKTQCKDMGPILGGKTEAHLLELSQTISYGEIKLLQALYIEEDHAYVLTGAVLKKDFLKNYKKFLSSFSSFQMISDLYQVIQDPQKRKDLHDRETELKKESGPKLNKKWKQFQKEVTKNFSSLGSYWQLLYLESIYQEIFPQNAN